MIVHDSHKVISNQMELLLLIHLEITYRSFTILPSITSFLRSSSNSTCDSSTVLIYQIKNFEKLTARKMPRGGSELTPRNVWVFSNVFHYTCFALLRSLLRFFSLASRYQQLCSCRPSTENPGIPYVLSSNLFRNQ